MISPIPPSCPNHFQATHHRAHWPLQGPVDKSRGADLYIKTEPCYTSNQTGRSTVRTKIWKRPAQALGGSKFMLCNEYKYKYLICLWKVVDGDRTFTQSAWPQDIFPQSKIQNLTETYWNHFFSDVPVLWYSHSTKIKSPIAKHRTNTAWPIPRRNPPWIASEWMEATIPPGWNHRSPGHSSNSLKNLGEKRSSIGPWSSPHGEWRGKGSREAPEMATCRIMIKNRKWEGRITQNGVSTIWSHIPKFWSQSPRWISLMRIQVLAVIFNREM